MGGSVNAMSCFPKIKLITRRNSGCDAEFVVVVIVIVVVVE
jgi:hypothetical protein